MAMVSQTKLSGRALKWCNRRNLIVFELDQQMDLKGVYMAIFIAPKDDCPDWGRLCYLAGDIGRGERCPFISSQQEQ